MRSKIEDTIGYKALNSDMMRYDTKTKKVLNTVQKQIVTMNSDVIAQFIQNNLISLGIVDAKNTSELAKVADLKIISPKSLDATLKIDFDKISSDNMYSVYKHKFSNDTVYIPNIIASSSTEEYLPTINKLYNAPYDAKYDPLLNGYADLQIAMYNIRKRESARATTRETIAKSSYLSKLLDKINEYLGPLNLNRTDVSIYNDYKSLKPDFKVKQNIDKLSKLLDEAIPKRINTSGFHNFIYAMSAFYESYKKDISKLDNDNIDEYIADFDRYVLDLDIKIYELKDNNPELRELIKKILKNLESITPEEASAVYNWYSATINPAIVTLVEFPKRISNKLAGTIFLQKETPFLYKGTILGGSFGFIFIIIFTISVLYIIVLLKRYRRPRRNIFNDKDPRDYSDPMRYILKEHSYTDDFQTNVPREYEIASISY